MILCSCNVLTLNRLLETARLMQAADPSVPVTPGRVLRQMGVRPRCGTCLSLIRDLLRDAGFLVTCPEPLAEIAEALGGKEVFEIEVAVVVTEILAPVE